MSRTRLCIITATALATISLAVMAARHYVLGPEVKMLRGPGTWKITLIVQGHGGADARVITGAPLDGGRQHILREQCHTGSFSARTQEVRETGARQVLWTRRPGAGAETFRVHYDCWCAVGGEIEKNEAEPEHRRFDVPPKPGAYVKQEPLIECDNPAIAVKVRELTAGIDRPADQAQTLFAFVADDIAPEPSLDGAARGAVECLNLCGGDTAAKARLLAALCRNCGIPARLAVGLNLATGDRHSPHVWVEAWVRDHWLPMCPVFRHFGRLPRTNLVFGFGDYRMVRGRNVRDLTYGFTVSKATEPLPMESAGSPFRKIFLATSLYALPSAEQDLVRLLLLLPAAAFIICLFRNVVGIESFGTFAPALIGLAFRDLRSLPGIFIFVSIVLVGWLMRRVLSRFHLLQVPRTALMLSLVVGVLVAMIVLASRTHVTATQYVALFPMIILIGMVERFWTLEEEDGARGAFRALLGTIVIAATVAVVTGIRAVELWLFRYPETLGLIMGGLLILGRYTGYRLSELIRFREFARSTAVEPVVIGARGTFLAQRF